MLTEQMDFPRTTSYFTLININQSIELRPFDWNVLPPVKTPCPPLARCPTPVCRPLEEVALPRREKNVRSCKWMNRWIGMDRESRGSIPNQRIYELANRARRFVFGCLFVWMFVRVHIEVVEQPCCGGKLGKYQGTATPCWEVGSKVRSWLPSIAVQPAVDWSFFRLQASCRPRALRGKLSVLWKSVGKGSS